MIRLILFLLASCLGCHVMAQNSDTKTIDKVELKDGSKLYGSLQSWDMTTVLVLKLENGVEVKIPATNIKKVTQESSRFESSKFWFEKGKIYGMVHAGGLMGRAPWGNVSLGGYFHLQGSYAILPKLCLGMGLGSEVYLPNDNADVASYPVYGTAQWTATSRILLGMMAGYSFVGKGQSAGTNVNYLDASGGPFLGMQLQYALSSHFGLNLGIQSTSKTRAWTQSWDTRNHGFDRFHHYRYAIGIVYRI